MWAMARMRHKAKFLNLGIDFDSITEKPYVVSERDWAIWNEAVKTDARVVDIAAKHGFNMTNVSAIVDRVDHVLIEYHQIEQKRKNLA